MDSELFFALRNLGPPTYVGFLPVEFLLENCDLQLFRLSPDSCLSDSGNLAHSCASILITGNYWQVLSPVAKKLRRGRAIVQFNMGHLAPLAERWRKTRWPETGSIMQIKRCITLASLREIRVYKYV